MSRKAKNSTSKEKQRCRMKTNTEPKSTGTRIAEKARARANTYSDSRRQQLLDRGLELIYGGSRHVKADRNRR
jgi:hypothetical protein